MPSPFPGMNPYLEQEVVWHDFHDSFLPQIRDALNAQVGDQYIIKIDEHIYIHDLSAEQRAFLGRGDITVAGLAPRNHSSAGVGVIEAPTQVELPMQDVERQSFLEIRDRRSRQVITVLEVLSPSNKNTGPDRDQYINKRYQLMRSGVNLVELDLLRGGPRMPFVNLPPCDYYAMVFRTERWPLADLWPIGLRQPLPIIPVPLRAPDPALRLELQPILHRIYDAAGYAKFIYDEEPTPPLSPEDIEWARTLIPSRA